MATQPRNQVIDLTLPPAEGMDESNAHTCTVPVPYPYPTHIHDDDDDGHHFHDDGYFTELMPYFLHSAMAADQCIPFDPKLCLLSPSYDAKQSSRRSWQEVLSSSSPAPAHAQLDVCHSGQDEAERPRPEEDEIEEIYEQVDNKMKWLISENGFVYLVMKSDDDDDDQQIISRSSNNTIQYASDYSRHLGWENHESCHSAHISSVLDCNHDVAHNPSIFGCSDAAEDMKSAAKGKRPYQTGNESTMSVITANGHLTDHDHQCTSCSREDTPIILINRPNFSMRVKGFPTGLTCQPSLRILSKKRAMDDRNVELVSTTTSSPKRIKKHVEAGRSFTSQTSQRSMMSRSSCLSIGLTDSAHDSNRSTNTQTIKELPDRHLITVEAADMSRSAAASSSSHHHHDHHSSSRRLRSQPALNTDGKPRALQGSANDPQSIAARNRRERINARIKILQELVPNGSKVDLVTMLEKAINYVKYLQLQLRVLSNDGYWNSSDHESLMMQPETKAIKAAGIPECDSLDNMATTHHT